MFVDNVTLPRHAGFTPKICFVDVDDVMYVINFDYPSSSEDYVHRIGRTARANKSGTAYTFFTNENMKNARDLLQVLEEAKQEVNPALAQLASMAGSFSRGKNLEHSSY